MNIRVLGPGCPNCRKLEAVVRQALTQSGIEATLDHVTDYPAIMKYGVMSTPGLVIDGKVLSAGRVPSLAEIKAWVQAAQSANG